MSLVDVEVVGHLHVFEHIQVLRGFNILSSDLSELFICDFHVNCVVNIRPLWGRSGFLAELRIPHHKIRCLFEIIESELLFDRSVAGSGPPSADLLEGLLGPNALLFPKIRQEIFQHFLFFITKKFD